MTRGISSVNINSKQKALTIDNGKIGIGTTNPKEQFQIGDRWAFHSGGTKFIGYNVYYDAATSTTKRFLKEDDNGNAIRSSLIAFSPTGDIVFRSAESDDVGVPITSFNTNLFLRHDGNVGIGDGVIPTHIKIGDRWYISQPGIRRPPNCIGRQCILRYGMTKMISLGHS